MRKILMSGLSGSWQEDVLNPGVVYEDGIAHMLYRGVMKGNISNIGYAKAIGGNIIERHSEPVIRCGLGDHNRVGVEDPRITKIGSTYYVLCTAYDGMLPRIEMFFGNSLISLESGGLISPCITIREALACVQSERYRKSLQELASVHGMDSIVPDKDGILFPEKIGGKFVGLRRTNPGIQLFWFESFDELKSPEYWKAHFRDIESHEVLWPSAGSLKVGAGAPPLRMDDKWLLFFHEVSAERVYTTHAAVLDSKLRLIERTKSPLCEPLLECERNGTVPNVIFTTGAVDIGESVELYSGGADSTIVYEPLEKSYLKEILPSLKL